MDIPPSRVKFVCKLTHFGRISLRFHDLVIIITCAVHRRAGTFCQQRLRYLALLALSGAALSGVGTLDGRGNFRAAASGLLNLTKDDSARSQLNCQGQGPAASL